MHVDEEEKKGVVEGLRSQWTEDSMKGGRERNLAEAASRAAAVDTGLRKKRKAKANVSKSSQIDLPTPFVRGVRDRP